MYGFSSSLKESAADRLGPHNVVRPPNEIRAIVPEIPPAGSLGSASHLRLDFLGIPLDCPTRAQAVAAAASAMQTRTRFQHGDINVAKFISCRSDRELLRCTRESDVVFADGMGILLASRLLGLPVPERVTGIDLMIGIIEVCARKGYRPYFLGAKPAVLRDALRELRTRYPDLEIAGSRDGYFTAADEPGVVADIRASKADCLFVGISSPIKETFLNRYRETLNVPVQLGVGGAFDVLAGHVRRAPLWAQKTGFEWLFRLVQEPRRLASRYFRTNAQFAIVLTGALFRRLLPLGR